MRGVRSPVSTANISALEHRRRGHGGGARGERPGTRLGAVRALVEPVVGAAGGAAAIGWDGGADAPGPRPATSMVEVSALIEPGIAVEIEADAIVSNGGPASRTPGDNLA